MSKKVIGIFLLLMVLTATFACTTFATAKGEEFEKAFCVPLRQKGWSEENITQYIEVVDIANVEFPVQVESAFVELGNWKSVREKFGITEERYAQWKAEQQNIKSANSCISLSFIVSTPLKI